MSQYPASGILFQNDRKQKETQPDYTGSMEVDPSVVRDLYAQLEEGNDRPKATLAGWKKISKNGKPFLSLRSDLLQERKQQSNHSGYNSQAPQQQASSSVHDDEIPF
tara:strand:- start:183 stop:503 length:321 start_codon:yes stop_codon:yes gene_type:complete